MSTDPDLFRELLDKTYDGVYFVDRQRRITYWNDAAETISGYRQDEMLGRRCWHNLLRHVDDQGRQLCRGWCPLVATMLDGEEREADVYMHHKDGHRVPIRVKALPIRDVSGLIVGAVEIFHETHETGCAHQIDQMALLDPLTHLVNRRYMQNQLQVRIDESQRGRYPCGLILADIDNLQQINQTYGEAMGDEMLQMVASTLSCNLRPTDIAARWSDDSFLIVVQSANETMVKGLMEKLRFLVEQSFLVREQRIIHVTVSLGATIVHMGDTRETLIQRLGDMVYQAKTMGGNRIAFE